jgi:hypothetical protein
LKSLHLPARRQNAADVQEGPAQLNRSVMISSRNGSERKRLKCCWGAWPDLQQTPGTMDQEFVVALSNRQGDHVAEQLHRIRISG